MRKFIARLRCHADLAFSLLVITCGLLLFCSNRAHPPILFVPTFLLTVAEFFAWLYSIWVDVLDFFVEVYRKVRALINLAWDGLIDICYWWYLQIRHIVIDVYDNLCRLLGELWTAVHRFFVDLWTAANFLLVSIFERLTSAGETVWSRLSKVVHDMWGRVDSIINTLYDKAYSIVHDMYDRIRRLIYDVWTNVNDFFTNLIDRAKRLLRDVWLNVDDFFTNLIDRAKTILRDKWDWLMSLGGTAIGDVIGLVTAKWPTLAWFFTDGWNFWATIFTEPRNLVYIVFGYISMYPAVFRGYLYSFSAHLLRFFWEDVW